MTEPAQLPSPISIRGLSKRYGKLTAVKGLHLEVNQGEILGFLGSNGAGKTTTIRDASKFIVRRTRYSEHA